MTHPGIRWLPPTMLILSIAVSALAAIALSHAVPPIHNALLVIKSACLEVDRQYSSTRDTLDTWRGPVPLSIQKWQKEMSRASAMAALLSGQFQAACRHFDPVSNFVDPLTGEKKPDYFVRLYRGICFQKQGQVNKARADWIAAATRIPGRHDAWMALGHSHLLEGDLLSAHARYMQAITLSGQLGIVYVDIGDAWRYIGQIDHAQEMYRRGISVDPGDVFSRLRLMEMALVLENNPRKALQIGHRIRRLMPDLNVVDTVMEIARKRLSHQTEEPLPHIPAARFEPGSSRQWKVPPTKILFEFFREDWNGWP